MDTIGCSNECKLLYSTFNMKSEDYNHLLIKFLSDNDSVISFTIADNQNIIIDNYPLTKLIYVYKGAVKIDTSGSQIDLSKDINQIHLNQGNLIFINAHSRTKIDISTNDTVLFVFHLKKPFFSVEFMDKLLEYNVFYNFINYCKMGKNSFHAHIVYDCNNFIVRQKLFILMKLISQKEFQFIKSSLLEIFDYLQNSQYSKLIPELSTNVSSKGFYEILIYIYTNYEKVTLDALANAFNYHRNYLSAMIKKESGMTLSEHIQNARLERAKNLLSDSNFSVLEISTKVGYTDVSYFNRLFKRNFGFRPNEYRKICKNK